MTIPRPTRSDTVSQVVAPRPGWVRHSRGAPTLDVKPPVLARRERLRKPQQALGLGPASLPTDVRARFKNVVNRYSGVLDEGRSSGER